MEELNLEQQQTIVEEPLVPLNQTVINFSFETQFGKFADALVFQEGEFEKYTPEQITEMQQQRLNNWLAFIKSTQVEG